MSDPQIKKQRIRWFKEHPYCYWCGCKLVLMPHEQRIKQWPGNAATVDHFYPRGHPERRSNIYYERRRVLSCLKCNKKRDQEFTASRSLEERWRLSGSWEYMLKITGCIDSPL